MIATTATTTETITGGEGPAEKPQSPGHSGAFFRPVSATRAHLATEWSVSARRKLPNLAAAALHRVSAPSEVLDAVHLEYKVAAQRRQYRNGVPKGVCTLYFLHRTPLRGMAAGLIDGSAIFTTWWL